MEFKNFTTEAVSLSSVQAEFAWRNWFYTHLVLPFTMQPQTQTNWCWAATAVSISKFYSSLSPWTQCKVAGAELSLTCCTSPVPSPCNVPWYLDRALTRTQNFVSIQSGTISWSRIKQELNNGLIIGTRIGWTGGGGHFMGIHGVSKILSTEYLHIDDPISGKSVLTYNQFATNYQGYGSWTHTYFTKKQFYFMWFKDLIFQKELLNPIPELRPLIDIYDKDAKIKQHDTDGQFNIPHHTYLMGLNEINERESLPEKPGSLRVIEVRDNKPLALFEVTLNDKNPELMQMQVSPAYFQQFDEGLSKLKAAAESRKELGEIRSIKVPALNIEALWLNYESKGDDLIVPLKRFENDSSIDWNKTYTEREFMAVLRELAKKINLQDDLLGA